MKPTLKVYVAEHCPGCAEAYAIAANIEQTHPQLRVQIIDVDLSNEPLPDTIFATPTYTLNGRVVSLGNPGPEDVARWINEIETGQVAPEHGHPH